MIICSDFEKCVGPRNFQHKIINKQKNKFNKFYKKKQNKQFISHWRWEKMSVRFNISSCCELDNIFLAGYMQPVSHGLHIAVLQLALFQRPSSWFEIPTNHYYLNVFSELAMLFSLKYTFVSVCGYKDGCCPMSGVSLKSFLVVVFICLKSCCLSKEKLLF